MRVETNHTARTTEHASRAKSFRDRDASERSTHATRTRGRVEHASRTVHTGTAATKPASRAARAQAPSSRKAAASSDSALSRLSQWAAVHPVWFGVLLALCTWAVLTSIFWLHVFTDFSGAAEFLYAQF